MREGRMPLAYLDANATEPLRPEARAAMLEALEITGNPASVHRAGQAARGMLERARERVAARFGARTADCVFTSGGTEANALAVHGLGRGRRLLVGATEHPAVLAAAPEAERLPVSEGGQVRLEALEAALRGGEPALVCLMLANNETGVLHPIAEAALLCRAHGALLHVDAVQAAGRMAVDLGALGASSLAVSSHKMGGPAGAGALLLAPGLEVTAVMAGGGQERGRRGGTPALAAIAGFAAACGCAPEPARLTSLRDAVEAVAVGRGAVVCGAGARIANTTCLALPGRSAQAQVIALDLAGVAVSAGAACSSGKIGASPVLQAMGLAPFAACAIRVSLAWNAGEDEVAAFARAYAGGKQAACA